MPFTNGKQTTTNELKAVKRIDDHPLIPEYQNDFDICLTLPRTSVFSWSRDLKGKLICWRQDILDEVADLITPRIIFARNEPTERFCGPIRSGPTAVGTSTAHILR